MTRLMTTLLLQLVASLLLQLLCATAAGSTTSSATTAISTSPPPPSGGPVGPCNYSSSDRTEAADGVTCEQFPDGGELVVDSTGQRQPGTFGVDIRAMTYAAAPSGQRDNTKFRKIVACSMAVGWANNTCGRNLACALGRLQQIDWAWEKAGARKCDIALLPEDFFGYTPQPVQVFVDALAPVAKKYNMYVAAGAHAIPLDYNSSVFHKTADPDNKVGFNTARSS